MMQESPSEADRPAAKVGTPAPGDCLECGATLLHTNGCRFCVQCGYSPCLA